MSGLVAFLNARLDEDEAAANEVHRPRDCGSVNSDGEFSADPIYCSCDGPARMRGNTAAKRAILTLHEIGSEPEIRVTEHRDKQWNTGWVERQETGRTSYWCAICDADRDYGHIGGPAEGCDTLRQLAAVYSDHPDYRDEWKP